MAALAAVLQPSGVAGSRAQWAAVAGSLQRVVDVASAAQDAAIVRLAAIEPEWLDDGTRGGGRTAPWGTWRWTRRRSCRGCCRSRRCTPSTGCGPRCGWPRTARPAPVPSRGWVGCTRRWAPGGWTPTGRRWSRPSWRRPRPRSRRRSWPRWRVTSRSRTPRTCGGGAVGCWPGSAPTCCASAPPGPGPSAGCGGGWRSRGSTGGRAPSRPRTPRRRGRRSTPWPAGTSPTGCAPRSSGPGARR